MAFLHGLVALRLLIYGVVALYRFFFFHGLLHGRLEIRKAACLYDELILAPQPPVEIIEAHLVDVSLDCLFFLRPCPRFWCWCLLVSSLFFLVCVRPLILSRLVSAYSC